MDFGPQMVGQTRFAPSPNGPLHIGHAFSALCAHDFARAFGGRFLLRIEDIDGTRSRAEHITGIATDLHWLGLNWDGEILYQSANIDRYRQALEHLKTLGLVYRCWCTRSEIAHALKTRPVSHGPDGPIYPGLCKGRVAGDSPHCWRIDMAAAMAAAMQRAGSLCWTDLAAGLQQADPMQFGDVILWRKDAPASYHLAATLDDAADGISHVVRGQDLFAYTAIHRLLQVLLELPEPGYWHHPLLLDENGEKLAKSRLSEPLALLRQRGDDGPMIVESLRVGKLPIGISMSRT
jgi:glutamyl-Q tRNA(Asp) synthetase